MWLVLHAPAGRRGSDQVLWEASPEPQRWPPIGADMGGWMVPVGRFGSGLTVVRWQSGSLRPICCERCLPMPIGVRRGDG
jgi:hypothetical protein